MFFIDLLRGGIDVFRASSGATRGNDSPIFPDTRARLDVCLCPADPDAPNDPELLRVTSDIQFLAHCMLLARPLRVVRTNRSDLRLLAQEAPSADRPDEAANRTKEAIYKSVYRALGPQKTPTSRRV
jgi:hypothetical protein